MLLKGETRTHQGILSTQEIRGLAAHLYTSMMAVGSFGLKLGGLKMVRFRNPEGVTVAAMIPRRLYQQFYEVLDAYVKALDRNDPPVYEGDVSNEGVLPSSN